MISEQTFLKLFVNHETEFRAFALSLMPQWSEADDLLQEACIQMWQKIDTLENELAFRSWAYTYIRFTALNMRRKRKRSQLVFSDDLLNLMAEEGIEDIQNETAEAEYAALLSCVEKLPLPQKEVITRYYASEKITMKQLSARIQRPVEGLYKMLQRARGTLKTCVQQQLADFA